MAKSASASKPASPHASTLELAEALRVATGRLSRRLREEAQLGDFTWSQSKVIVRLDRDGPATVTALAQAEGVRPQSMGATVAELRAAGLVDGTPDPNDGRQTVLSLSNACRKALKTARAAKQDWLARALEARFTPAERARFADMLPLLDRLGQP